MQKNVPQEKPPKEHSGKRKLLPVRRLLRHHRLRLVQSAVRTAASPAWLVRCSAPSAEIPLWLRHLRLHRLRLPLRQNSRFPSRFRLKRLPYLPHRLHRQLLPQKHRRHSPQNRKWLQLRKQRLLLRRLHRQKCRDGFAPTAAIRFRRRIISVPAAVTK